ncbi:glycosyltransferase [Bradyrhizobium centrosematis]|uniref:glycosyltransferase n=1 Tax=Bradyrhizobium centrosematis TaxID=1300039 RepID=UPI00388E5FEB
MRVLFAPDYRAGNPYQQMLADALRDHSIQTEFLSDYRRLLPLWRGVKDFDCDLLHLHWPEKYYQRRGDGIDLLRRLRYPTDLRLALRRLPLVFTAHDLLPHNRAGESFLQSNYQYTLNRAKVVFAHSSAAAAALSKTYRFDDRKCRVIPHGDLAKSGLHLPNRIVSRDLLGLPQDEAICLMFGRVEPYKGIEEVIRWWVKRESVTLAIVGEPISLQYSNRIRDLAHASSRVRLCLEWQSGEQLRNWLAAVDCALFNYSAILTSGAASEARSYGVPILLPHRLSTIDLMEPHPRVFRFNTMESDFDTSLHQALAVGHSYEGAREWRELTSWRKVAQATSECYRSLMNAERASRAE